MPNPYLLGNKMQKLKDRSKKLKKGLLLLLH